MASFDQVQKNSYQKASDSLKAGANFLNILKQLSEVNTITTRPLPEIPYLQDAGGGARDAVFAFAPTRPLYRAVGVVVPDAPNIGFSAPENVVVPEFAGQSPEVSLPSPPSMELPGKPDAPTIGNIPVPSAPVVTMPTVPTISDVSLPVFEPLPLPSFDVHAPEEDLTAPTNTFQFWEERYTSELLDELKRMLSGDLSGGNGMHPTDEAGVFGRTIEREQVIAESGSGQPERDFRRIHLKLRLVA